MPRWVTASAVAVSIVGFLAGCATGKATQYSVPPERASECKLNCAALDMYLGAVVIMASQAGCVCVPKGVPPSVATAGGAGAAGGMTIVLAEQQAAASRRSAAAAQRRP